MAPPSDAAKALQGNRTRPTARAIVPAIPLPYIQKRKKQIAVAPKVQEAASPPISPVVETIVPSVPAAADLVAVTTNGSSDTITVPDAEATPAHTQPATPIPEADVEEKGTELQPDPVNGHQPVQESRSTPVVATSDTQSTGSRTTYNMPPPFVPANIEQLSVLTIDPNRFSRQPQPNGQFAMHHPHPSVGSLVFGGYPESTNSSPAPPLSAGDSQQYQVPGQLDTGRAQSGKYSNGGGHLHNLSNGFSPTGPMGSSGPYPRQDMYVNQNGMPENYARRQMVSFAPSDVSSPAGSPYVDGMRFPPYDPSNLQSFHGSQSSAPAEQEVNGLPFFAQNVTGGSTNGMSGHAEDPRLYHQPLAKVRTGSQSAIFGQGHYAPPSIGQHAIPPNMDNLDGLLGYLQSQFADPQFADYVLELRYSDDRAEPVRIPGHNLLFARSPALKKLMTVQAKNSTADEITSRTIFIESDDRFLRSDGFWMAVQRLYGAPLLAPGATAPISNSASQPQSSLPGTPADRFDLALGYAAAGHILEMPPVVNRGLDIASHFVNWQTIERAFDFALDGGLHSQWTQDHSSFSPNTYGPDVLMLINGSLNFIIREFPPNFDLDCSVSNPVHNTRLPVISEIHSATLKHRFPRFSSIKFGDHSTEDPILSHQGNNNPLITTLSRILLNLPFQLLKYVLESPRLGNVSGWATASLREKVMHSVIAEREKRRNTVLQSKDIPNAEREANMKVWEAVGWKENVRLISADVNALDREWVGVVLPDVN